MYLKTLLYKNKDINGFTPQKSQELKEAIIEAKNNKKPFSSSKELIKDVLL